MDGAFSFGVNKMLLSFADTTPHSKLFYTSYKPGFAAGHTLNYKGKDLYFLKRNGKMVNVSHDIFYMRVFLGAVI